MLLTSPLIPWRLAAGLAAAAICFAAGCWVGARWVHADWAEQVAADAEAERQRVARIRDELERADMAAYRAAEQYEVERQQLESTHAHALSTLRKSLLRPLACPGGTLADVVLPADAVAGLRIAAGADRVPAAEPAASESGR